MVNENWPRRGRKYDKSYCTETRFLKIFEWLLLGARLGHLRINIIWTPYWDINVNNIHVKTIYVYSILI